jgi:hypothetical protein
MPAPDHVRQLVKRFDEHCDDIDRCNNEQGMLQQVTHTAGAGNGEA